MLNDVNLLQVAASLILVAVALVTGWALALGLTRRLVVAAVRAAVQLMAIGLVLARLLGSGQAMALAWAWVVGMVAITAVVARRRAPELPGGATVAGAAVAGTVAITLLVVFGLEVLAYQPVNVIVVAGITVGNVLPSQVLGSSGTVEEARDRRGQIEALLALGFTVGQIVRVIGGPVVRRALIPQIERTNVVGLIALPGAMTGLLLAGADPVDAVLVQLIVMYLLLGAVATSVTVTVVFGLRSLFTVDRRLRVIE